MTQWARDGDDWTADLPNGLRAYVAKIPRAYRWKVTDGMRVSYQGQTDSLRDAQTRAISAAKQEYGGALWTGSR